MTITCLSGLCTVLYMCIVYTTDSTLCTCLLANPACKYIIPWDQPRWLNPTSEAECSHADTRVATYFFPSISCLCSTAQGACCDHHDHSANLHGYMRPGH